MHGKYMRSLADLGWSLSWLGQKVKITLAGVALTGGDDSALGDFDPTAMCMNPDTVVISVTEVTRKIYSVLASNGLAFTLSTLSTSKGCQV